MAMIFPVVGATEWSGGSYMDLSHRDRTHHAIDIYAEKGALIVTPVKGKVAGAGTGEIGGNWITIKGDDGNTYYFAHMGSPTHLKVGDDVSGGSSLGFVGNSGSAATTKAHLHFSVKNSSGVAINPTSMLNDAILVPDFEKEVTGVSAPRRYHEPAASGDWITQGSNAGDNSMEQPAWIDQLNQARQDRLNRPGEEPRKVRAAEIVRGTLRGMARMVRSQGFQTPIGANEYDEDQVIVSRGDKR